MAHEYPKMLFPSGDVGQPYKLANNPEQEVELLKAGYLVARNHGVPVAEPERREFEDEDETPDASPADPTPRARGRNRKDA